MMPQKFLSKVWPSTGLYCIATPFADGGYQHKIFESIPAAAAFAEELDRQNKNVFYAMSTLKERRVWNAKLEKYQIRTKANMHSLKTFFFDVDVVYADELEGMDEARRNSKYTSREDALNAIKLFTHQIGWPKPTLISSGGGFHVYWTLTKAISAEMYSDVAARLKIAAQNLGFKLDTGALDISRVLRVVGTHNHKKSEPTEVRMLIEGVDSNPKALYTSLKNLVDEMGVTIAPRPEPVPEYLKTLIPETNIERHFDSEPASFERIASKCATLKHYQDVQGQVGYHYWLHALQVTRLCEDGEQLSHTLSSGDPAYDADKTDNLLADLAAKGIGPTKCETFAFDNPEACGACPHRGKVTSPIVLGRVPRLEEAIAVIEEVQTKTAKVTVLPPPSPYKRVHGKGIFITKTTKDGDDVDVQIYDHDLYPIARVHNERENKEYIKWGSWSPSDGHIEIEIAASTLFDKRTFAASMADLGIYLNYDLIDDVRYYMVAYIKELQKSIAREALYSRLGWRDEHSKFILGDRMYDNGIETISHIEQNSRLADAITTKGNLNEWMAAAEMYNRTEFIPHQFAFGAAFGAPLMSFTGQAGGILHLVGLTGEGKSAVQKLVNSVWGRPLDLMLPADPSSSTANARIAYIHTLNNLPVCAEEITNIASDELSSLAYSMNLGEEKIRLQRTGELKKHRGGWSTIMLSSANASLHEKLIGTNGAMATTLRVLEMRLPMRRVYSRADFEEAFIHRINDNHGHAGAAYAAAITQMGAATLRSRVAATMRRLDMRAGTTNEERVWVAIAAACVTGLEIAKECGLHNYNVDAVEGFAVRQIQVLRTGMQSVLTTPVEALAAYIDENLSYILAIGDDIKIGGKAEPLIVRKPVGGIYMRMDIPKQRLSISAAHLRTWANKHGMFYGDMIDTLYENKIVTNKGHLKVLGARTEFASGQTRCVEIDTSNENFSGMNSIMGSQTSAEPTIRLLNKKV